jgi:hypothetical protein
VTVDPPTGTDAELATIAGDDIYRRRGDKKIASRPYSVVLQVGEQKPANVFSGAMLPWRRATRGGPR